MSMRRTVVGVIKEQESDVESVAPLITKNVFPLELDAGSAKAESQPLTKSSSSSTSGRYDDAGRRILQVASLSAFLVFWLANEEVLQGITTGGPILGVKDHDAYDKPIFITWYSFNYLVLSLPFVTVFVTSNTGNGPNGDGTVQESDEKSNWRGSFIHYFRYTWPGRLGWQRAMLSCLVISWMLQFLNILTIIGLKCISISLSNALYQLKAGFTLGLSVLVLKDPIAKSQVAGVLVSFIGITWIVAPQLLFSTSSDVLATTSHHSQQLESSSTVGACGSISLPIAWGSMATLLSAALGALYLVSWRILDERRDRLSMAPSHVPPSRLDDLVDTQMTLAMIGVCNLLAGWPLVVLAHMTGMESFEWPQEAATTTVETINMGWTVMRLNALVEYLFEASCAIAIYITSPLTVAVVSPLTIPLSMFLDRYNANHMTVIQNGIHITPTESSIGYAEVDLVSAVGGTIVILIGIWLMEAKLEWWT